MLYLEIGHFVVINIYALSVIMHRISSFYKEGVQNSIKYPQIPYHS